jgi:hypothetical protein
MPTQATATDAQLILQLYELRREAEMRKARAWFGGTFSPQSAEDLTKMIGASGQENTWLRQVVGYWEMAAALVAHGTLNEELFFDTNGEMWFLLGKLYAFLPEFREKAQAPYVLQIVEKVATKSEAGRNRLQHMVKMHEARRKAS